MIKQISRDSRTISPFNAIKEWELSNVNKEDLVLIEPPGEIPEYPIALDYVDYSSGSPISNSECNIALEQQEDDLAIYQEGISGSGVFDPSIDEFNFDGTFKRLIYDQIEKAFYNSYKNPTKIFGMDNIDFPLSQTIRNIGNELLVFTVPQLIMGDRLMPKTVVMYDNLIDDTVVIRDDGFGNLFAQHNLFSKVQEVRKLGNVILNGALDNCFQPIQTSVTESLSYIISARNGNIAQNPPITSYGSVSYGMLSGSIMIGVIESNASYQSQSINMGIISASIFNQVLFASGSMQSQSIALGMISGSIFDQIITGSGNNQSQSINVGMISGSIYTEVVFISSSYQSQSIALGLAYGTIS